MIEALNKTSAYDKRSIRDNLILVAWILAWMISLTISDKAALHGWWSREWITIFSIAVNLGIGLWVIRTYIHLLRGMDDLQRRIQLEAISLALGLTAVGTISYSLLVTWGYITDEEVSDIFVLLCVSYSAAVMINVLRYR